MPTRTTGTGTPSDTHSEGRNFGRRRTDGNLDTFRIPEDLNYVSRPTTAEDGDNAKDVREKILKGTLGQSRGTASSDLQGYYGITEDQVSNMFNYNAPDVVAERGNQPAYGPNLAIPPFASSRPVNSENLNDEGVDDGVDESDAVTEDRTDTIIGVTYGAMARESSENRANPSENSTHPRDKRPSMTSDADNIATMSTSGVGAPPAEEE